MTETQLQNLLKQYRVPVHIVDHMKKVAAVGTFIVQKLRKKGEKINPKTVKQAALLHDLVKMCDFKKVALQYFKEHPSHEDLDFWQKLIEQYHQDGHCVAGYKILKSLGENEVAVIVKKHRFASLIDKNVDERPQSWEEKIVYYADKRVKHDQIVSIEERLIDGQKRYFPYGNIPAEDRFVKNALGMLEKEICQKADLKPEDINEKNVNMFCSSLLRI